MCPNSYVYTVDDIKKMNPYQLGQAIWEYAHDEVITEMVEAYGSVEATAAAVVDVLSDGYNSEAVEYVLAMGTDTMQSAVVAYLECHI